VAAPTSSFHPQRAGVKFVVQDCEFLVVVTRVPRQTGLRTNRTSLRRENVVMKLQSFVLALSAVLFVTSQWGMSVPAQAAGAYAPATSPRTLCLSAGEVNNTLGGTFRVIPGTSIGNMGPGMSNLQIVKKAGLVSSYEVTYTRQHPGETMVLNGVNLFRTAAFARSGIGRVLRAYRTASSQSSGVRAVPSHDVGDAAAIVTFQERIGHGAVLHGLGIIFSQGRYAADVMVYSTSTVDRGKVRALARSVDTRIQNA
jgi:hypothetical protein